MTRLEALEEIAELAERIIYNATSLQPDQFNPDTCEVDASLLNAAMVALNKLEQIEEEARQPERAFVLEGKFQADSADDLAWLLRNFADAIDRNEVGIDGFWASPSGGATYRYRTNAAMTHDAYFTAVDEWQKQGAKK